MLIKILIGLALMLITPPIQRTLLRNYAINSGITNSILYFGSFIFFPYMAGLFSTEIFVFLIAGISIENNFGYSKPASFNLCSINRKYVRIASYISSLLLLGAMLCFLSTIYHLFF